MAQSRASSSASALSFMHYTIISGYNAIAWRGSSDIPASDESEDPWRTTFDDFKDWMTGPRAKHSLTIIGVAAISMGTWIASNQVMRSTYICFASLDSQPQVIIAQYVGLALDAGIVINLWRVLFWTRSFEFKLRTLSKIFLISSMSIAVLWMAINMTAGNGRVNVTFGHLYGFDVLVDSFAFATLAISATNWDHETTPIMPSVSITSLVGIGRAASNIFSLGDWMHLSRSASLLPLLLIASGLIAFVYVNDIRCVVFIRRTLLVFLIVILLITCMIFTLLRPLSHFEERHPVNDLIYEAHAVHARWILKAATSRSIATAVTTYEERHGSRSPPPNFGEWYQFASGSAVIDDFPQIDKDMDPFWSMTPATLRKRVELVTSYAGVGSITVKDGQVVANGLGDDDKSLDLQELVNMIRKFSRHLPEMTVPVNLNHAPRVIPSWTDKRLHSQAYLQSMAKVISTRSENDSAATADVLGLGRSVKSEHNLTWHQTWASDFRHMYSEACPSASLVKTNPHWDFSSFCSACVEPHSSGQFVGEWLKSLETCNQPDLSYLHSFFMTDPILPPIQELVPLFSSFKTEGFSDIVLPLSPSRADERDREEPFSGRKDTLFWSTSIGAHAINEQSLRGSHKMRLLHLINDPDGRDRVTVVLPLPKSEESFKSESVLVTEANHDLSFKVGVRDYDSCLNKNCDLIEQTYGKHADGDDPLNYRYILLTDEDDGPPKSFLNVLRSQSTPFVSTIFQTWYSDRLTPWLHFVPIDIRYQALHATILYFTGTAHRAKMNGIDRYLKGRPGDAEWIAQQGQRWAAKALQNKDREIYLFRLLLEWGRLIDDRRDYIGYRKDINGEYKSDEWSRPA
ncbi:hypothetical protein C2857_002191 [Epichloe festucae Fl1]|uniref:Glycosyltransferase family 90 protein n=1 Tax=Epichloe festucae (strain Fl1) TaxID=877507 RepID=A0A7S9KNH9_EPIFF|nr:hypothetical protein C2857_002191 [Epichloe festucae Fl1]